MESTSRTFNICLLRFLEEGNGDNAGEIRYETLTAESKADKSTQDGRTL